MYRKMSLQNIEKCEIGAIAQNENTIETKPPGLGFGEHDMGGHGGDARWVRRTLLGWGTPNLR